MQLDFWMDDVDADIIEMLSNFKELLRSYAVIA